METLYKLDKSHLRRYIHDHLLVYDSKLKHKLSKRLMNDVIVYLQGFWKCLLQLGENPMNEKEIQSLLYQEAVEYLIKRLKNE